MKFAPITWNKLTSARTRKVVLSWILTIAIGLIFVFGAVALVKAIDSDTKTVVSSWARGSLDENGNYVESKESIYTKKAFECAGLEITLDFDAVVSYEVVFYDKNGDMLADQGRTGLLEGAFDSDTLPEDAYYARVIVTPVEDENITMLEVAEYAGQIKISVAK